MMKTLLLAGLIGWIATGSVSMADEASATSINDYNIKIVSVLIGGFDKISAAAEPLKQKCDTIADGRTNRGVVTYNCHTYKDGEDWVISRKICMGVCVYEKH